MRLIDADALIEKINDAIKKRNSIDIDVFFTCDKVSALNYAIDMVRNAPTAIGWTNVRDGLPKKKGGYFVYHTDGTVWPYWYDPSENEWFDQFGSRVESVTHWMSQPAPPTN